MEKVLCAKCGNEMEETELKGMELCLKTGKVWISQIMECEKCNHWETLDIEAKITSIDR